MDKIKKILDYLKKRYPDAACSLDATVPWQLLFSTRLAAQCTDKRVNIVAQVLYEKYPTLEAMAAADISELEEILYPVGFFRQKAKDLKTASLQLLTHFGGQVPDNMEDLISLSGIGRKTANLILGDVYGLPAIVADTHLIRFANRMGLVHTKDPHKVEIALKEIIPPAEQTAFCHRAVYFGRDLCRAQRPDCAACGLREVCTYI